jgi:gluconolactonase
VTAIRDAERDLAAVASDVDHPECVVWHGGRLWCGTEAGELLRIEPGGATVVAAETDGFLLGLCFDGDGRCLACDAGLGRLLRIEPFGRIEVVADAVSGRRLVNPNFPAFAPDGTLWMTESGSRWGADDGYLVALRPGGSPRRVDDESYRFPNGLAVSVDGSVLYVVESRLPGVVAYDLLGGSALGKRRVVAELPHGTVPDGLALDVLGRLYISCWRPDRVYRLGPDGPPDVFLDDPTGEYLTTPTNLCFGGEGLSTLYLASLGGREIRSLDAGVAGILPHTPTVQE